jgi:peptidyl-prolyl cis-trans isomerase SurA
MIKLRLIIILFFLIFFSFLNSTISEEVLIKFKIDNEIVTNLDIINEENYLISLNNNLKNISKNNLRELAKNSLIREKIKKKELLKYFDFKKANQFVDKVVAELYQKLNFKNKDEFKIYLSNFNLKLKDVNEKLKIETLWNQLIFDKFNGQVTIDAKKIEENLKKQILHNKNYIEKYNLSEIFYKLEANENLDNKYNLISNSIKNNGFQNTANLFSLSDSSKFGGNIGWIDKTQLNEKIVAEINQIKSGQLTNPIEINNGFLILKINKKEKIEKKINFEEELNKLIAVEKNNQLNQFSLIYFNKVKQNIYISEK